MIGFRWFTVVALVGAACTEGDESLELGMVAQGLCPSWGCGQNSPIMGPYSFHELNVNHLANAEGIAVIDFVHNGKSLQPQIANGSELIAIDLSGVSLTGKDLEGGHFNVATPGGVYQIIVTKVTPKDVSPVTFWFGPKTQIATYELAYIAPRQTHAEPLCKNPPDRESGEGEGRYWEAPLEAILFTGDRYNATKKLVTATETRETFGWFNIACAGSALAKMHLTRHTTAGISGVYTTIKSQRQALLKMYVGDYCGTGTSWTKPGTPLHWQNSLGWSQLDGNEFSIESLWTSAGATCLDTHRLGWAYENSVRTECDPPPCPTIDPSGALPGGAYIVSAVPKDPEPNPNI
jgi:hypothetical protein